MTDFRLAPRSPDYAELMHFTPEASLAGYGLLLALVRDESTETRVERSVHTAPNGTRRVSTRERTEYHLLLELEDGERQSHEVPEELARRVVIGDLGVAYYKAGDLLDFRPLRQPG